MTDPTTTKSQAPVQIGEVADGERSFVLRPASNDLFVRTGKQIISDCSMGITVEVWQAEVQGLARRVRDWAQEHAAVGASYIALGPGGVRVYVVPTVEEFDFALAREVAMLGRELLTNHQFVGPVEVNQIPAGAVSRFVSEALSQQVYGR